MDPDLLLENIVSTVKTAKAFGLPIVHSTVNVVARDAASRPCRDLAELLDDDPPIDRTSTNAWEDADFLAAVRATGRRKLILCALWTEICMAFPHSTRCGRATTSIPVVDAIGGTSEEAAPGGARASRPGRRQSGRLGRPCVSSSSATGRARRPSPTSSRSC